MEVSGAVARQTPFLFRRQSGDRSSSQSFTGVSTGSGTRDLRLTGRRFLAVSGTQAMKSGLREDGHLQYYLEPRCDRKSKEEKQKKKQKEKVKRDLELLKRLSGGSYASSQMGVVLRPHGDLDGELHWKLVSETTETLVRQVKQLKAEQKELKKKRRLQKAKLKAARMRSTTRHSSSSSSSSESSDEECGDVIDMRNHNREALPQPHHPDEWYTNTVQQPTLTLPARNDDGNDGGPAAMAASGQRVEVCMGNKCRKGGAAMLMEEFERVLGEEGAVCGCRCMGKCRVGPNVRVSSDTYNAVAVADPLCIGVGLEDVATIVADFFASQHLKHAPAT